MKRQIIMVCFVGGLLFVGVRAAGPVQSLDPAVVKIKVGGKEAFLSQKLADLSPLLVGILRTRKKEEQTLPVVTIEEQFVSSDLLPLIVVLLEKLNGAYKAGKSEGKIPDLTKILAETGVGQKDVVPLIKAFHYLGVNSLVALLMFTYGKEEETRDSVNNLIKNMKVTGLPKDIQENIDKMSFSVGELISLGRVARVINGSKLNLASNKISRLDGIDDIEGFKSLKELNLSHNLLTILHPAVFKDLVHLKNLYLSNNQLIILFPGAFDELSELKKLYLYTNKLTSLPSGIFKGLDKLELLSLRNNPIEIIEDGAFDSMPEGLSLDLIYKGNNYDSLSRLKEVLATEREEKAATKG